MKIKLVIWDLDDTLWHGTLADGDDVQLIECRAEALRRLNSHGVVSAVCSKNDRAAALERLEHFGLTSEIVFARIEFAPKGQMVKEIIEDMQLRPVNVLFIDDNPINLNEVKHYIPDINVQDGRGKDCDTALEALIEDNRLVSKSRVEEYRALEIKTADRRASKSSSEDFLRSCDLHLAVAKRGDLAQFAPRIEELINRSNQLNFTKSRVQPDSMRDFVLSPWQRYDTWAVFAWDRYGYHGLVGFAAVGSRKKLLHFVFSCRIMHMGAEEYLLAVVAGRYPAVDLSKLPIQPKKAEWISPERYALPATRAFVLGRESVPAIAEPEVRIMFDCQSAGIAHFGGLNDVAAADLYPRRFKIRGMLKRGKFRKAQPRALVYGAFTDYVNRYAPGKTWNDEDYEACATNFANAVTSSGRRALVVLPPRNAKKFEAHRGVTQKRVETFNAIWERLSAQHPEIHLLDLTDIGAPEDIIDVRHYEIPLVKLIAAQVAAWYRSGGREQPAL